MTKYLVLYRAENTAAEQMAGNDPEAAEAGMQAWMQWAEKAGPAIVDLGSPTQPVAGPGGGDPIGGYSILQAESLEALQEVLDGHPHTSWGGTIDVLELLEVPGM
jgi:hypothetical protein